MIVDTSALVAIVFKEPGYEAIIELLAHSSRLAIGTPTVVELGIVLSARLGHDANSIIVRIFDEFDIREIPFGSNHWREALSAYARFGRGRHPAQLNFGDCLTYAVARLADEPLLFVGGDFSRTDLTPGMST